MMEEKLKAVVLIHDDVQVSYLECDNVLIDTDEKYVDVLYKNEHISFFKNFSKYEIDHKHLWLILYI